MLTPKKLVEMFRRWRHAAAVGRQRIMSVNTDTASLHMVASKGHVYVYTTDQKRFMVPLKYLSSSIFQELFKMSEEEYGLPTDGPIVLPCDATCMAYIISLVESQEQEELEIASVLASMSASRCSVSAVHQAQQVIIYGL